MFDASNFRTSATIALKGEGWMIEIILIMILMIVLLYLIRD